MKYLFTCILLCAIALQAKAQITKGYWLVGGTGTFKSFTDKYVTPTYSVDYKYINLNLTPSIGYYFMDKLAAGLKPSFSWIKGEGIRGTGGYSGGRTDMKKYGIGPFARYYFLHPDQPINFLVDVSYIIGNNDQSGPAGKFRTFSAMTGPVYYFNSAIGLELLLGYFNSNERFEGFSDASQEGFQLSIGFQIHLIKE